MISGKGRNAQALQVPVTMDKGINEDYYDNVDLSSSDLSFMLV